MADDGTQNTEDNESEDSQKIVDNIPDNNSNIPKKELDSESSEKRKGPGRPLGSMNKATMETKVAKKRFIERVNQHVDDLFNAQLSLAQGEQVLMVQITEGEGKNQRRYHEVVEDKETIKQYLDYEGGVGDNENPSDAKHWYYLTTRAANNQAIDSLLNRSFGKAPDKVEVEGGFLGRSKLVIEVIDGGSNPSEDESEDQQETANSAGSAE